MRRNTILIKDILATGENYYKFYSMPAIKITKNTGNYYYTENFANNERKKLIKFNFLNLISTKMISLRIELWKILKRN
jgi:hypothetical protein